MYVFRRDSRSLVLLVLFGISLDVLSACSPSRDTDYKPESDTLTLNAISGRRSLSLVPPSDVEGYFSQLDKNDDGLVDATEWMGAPFGTEMEDFENILEMHDDDGNGAVSIEELDGMKVVVQVPSK